MTLAPPSSPQPRRRLDLLAIYRFALREGDARLAELLHRRFVDGALAARIVRTLEGRLRAVADPGTSEPRSRSRPAS